MHERLPAFLQPLLTWLTARPAPGETMPERSPAYFVASAVAQTIGGAALSWTGMLCPFSVGAILVPLGLILSTSGLGLFQVVVFHHCSHGTVFRNRETNIRVGRLISAILLFKHFDVYKHEHMLHHSPNKLLTEEDEFADFVFGMCGLKAGLPKRALWRKVLSPLSRLNFTAVLRGDAPVPRLAPTMPCTMRSAGVSGRRCSDWQWQPANCADCWWPGYCP